MATCDKRREYQRTWYHKNKERLLELRKQREHELRNPMYMAPDVRDRINNIIEMLTWRTAQVEDAEYMIRTAMKARRELGLLLEGQPAEDEIRRIIT